LAIKNADDQILIVKSVDAIHTSTNSCTIYVVC